MVRLRNRYLLVEFVWEDGKIHPNVSANMLKRSLLPIIEENFGEIGLGTVLSSFVVKYWNPSTNFAVLRCSRDHNAYKTLWASLALLEKVDGSFLSLRCRHCAGSIRSCTKALLRIHKEAISIEADVEM